MHQENLSLKFIDLFAGAGGFSCGLEMAGHQCLLGVDFDAHAMKTFAINHPKAQTYCGDIKNVNQKKLSQLIGGEKVDLVVGGPPCQGLSTVGLGDPQDHRNHLFLEFCRIVKMTSPRFIIMENVTGLLAKKNQLVLKKILSTFTKLGFHLSVQVIQTEKYGVAEKRRRTIFLGSKINDQVFFPSPTHDIELQQKFIPPVTVGEIFRDLKSLSGEIHNHDLKAAQVKSPLDLKRIQKIPEGHGIRYQEDEDRYFPKNLKMGVDWQKLPEQRLRQTRYQRLNRQSPSPTILTNRHTYFHPTEDRYLTVREAAKIQSFPNEFIFTGSLSAQWRQIGNAVPPLLGKVLGDHLKVLIKLATEQKKVVKKNQNLEESVQTIRKTAFIYQTKN